MANHFDNCLKAVSKFLKKDVVFKDFIKAVCLALEDAENAITETKNNFFFDKMNLKAVLFMENLLKITPTNTQTLDNRRDVIRAKWRSYGHNSILLIQNVCNAWKNGEVEADFVGGKIQLKFVGEYGVPEDLQALLNAINKIKPSHLAYFIVYKYLLKKNIHNTLTKSQMQTYKKHQFCNAGINIEQTLNQVQGDGK